jgi:hypothetical protein
MLGFHGATGNASSERSFELGSRDALDPLHDDVEPALDLAEIEKLNSVFNRANLAQ